MGVTWKRTSYPLSHLFVGMGEILKYSKKARYPMVEQCSKAYDINYKNQ